MPRIFFPSSFSPAAPAAGAPIFGLRNPRGHALSIQPISDTVVRVVHQLPLDKFPQKTNGGIAWEAPHASAAVEVYFSCVYCREIAADASVNRWAARVGA